MVCLLIMALDKYTSQFDDTDSLSRSEISKTEEGSSGTSSGWASLHHALLLLNCRICKVTNVTNLIFQGNITYYSEIFNKRLSMSPITGSVLLVILYQMEKFSFSSQVVYFKQVNCRLTFRVDQLEISVSD